MTNSGLGRARSGARGGNALIRHGRYAGALVALAAVVSGAGSCADLIDIDHDVCGNQILDPGEDCDGHDDTSGSPCAAPGEPAACRFTCVPTAEPPVCPSGYACGADGVCARPSNRFVSESLFQTTGGSSVAVGDFDGDTVNDVAIVSRAEQSLTIDFMRPGLTTGGEQVLPADPTSAMTVGFVDGDSRADLLVGSQGALRALTSSGGRRELVGTAFASYLFKDTRTHVLEAPARASVVPDNLPLTISKLEPDADSEGVATGSETATIVYLINPYTQKVFSPKGFDVGATRLLSPRRGAVVDRTGKDACDEIVLAYRAAGGDGGKVAIVPTCDGESAPIYPLNGALCAVGAPPSVYCPALIDVGGEDVSGVFSAEVDADAGRELVVVLGEPGAPAGLEVVEADVDSFVLATPLPPSVARLEDFILSSGFAGAVLHIEDLNDDGQLDVVGSKGAFVSAPDGNGGFRFYRAAAPLAGSDWGEAVSGDFNGDGRRDLVAAPTRASDLDLVLGSSGSYFNPTVLATESVASVLVTGDFDGDGLGDVVMRERSVDAGDGVPSCANADDLVIRFGEPSGLGERRLVARVAGIEEMRPGRLPRLDKRDSIQDFGVVLHCEATEPTDFVSRVAVFYGALDRQIAAPQLLLDQLDEAEVQNSTPFIVPYQPRATATRQTESAKFLATLATPIAAFQPDSVPDGFPPPSDVALFVVESAADEDLTIGALHLVPLQPAILGSLGEELDSLSDRDFHVAVTDVDGGGVTSKEMDVIFTVGNRLFVLRDWTKYTEETELVTLPSVADDLSSIDLPGAATDLEVADFDGDGAADVAVAGNAVPTDGADLGAPYLLVFFGGGAELERVDIDLGGERVVALGALPSYATSAGADSVQTSGVSLVVVAGPALNTQTVRSISLAGRLAATPEVLGASTYTGVNSMSVADIDGDRFEDIVLVTDAVTNVIVRQPQLAGDPQGAVQ